MTVNIYRVRPDAKLPVRAHSTDAGLDLFFCPVEGAAVRINPGQSVLLDTGIKMEVPSNCMLQIMNKSGIASKNHLITGACVVDEGYTGEIFVNLHNIGKDVEFIEPGQKSPRQFFVRIENLLCLRFGKITSMAVRPLVVAVDSVLQVWYECHEKTKKGKAKQAKKDVQVALGLFDKIPDHCLTCFAPYDRMNKEQVMSWNVVVREKEGKVNLLLSRLLE